MDSEVARTLGELERKLQELERALTSVSRDQQQTSAQQQTETSAPQRTADPPSASSSTPAPSAGPPGAHGASGARLVDERLESSRESFSSPPSEPPPSPSFSAGGRPGEPDVSQASGTGFDESIELAELTRFRDRLEQTLRDLVADYERVICLRGASADRPSAETR